MTWIKICGITNLEDAQTAVDAGADALGFVFYEKSPRNMAPDAAREIVAKLPDQIEKVGVFVNGVGPQPFEVAREVGLTAIQTSFGFPPTGGRSSKIGAHAGFPRPPKQFLAMPVAWFLQDPEKMKDLIAGILQASRNAAARLSLPDGWFDFLLLDSGSLQQPGGTGRTFDWQRAKPIADDLQQRGLKLIVAGGLTSDNVSEAMRILKPWGVDVSSGVEAKPGKKDPEKVRAFVSGVRKADEIA
jgi:phosphoribosylanthranilate isomerase